MTRRWILALLGAALVLVAAWSLRAAPATAPPVDLGGVIVVRSTPVLSPPARPDLPTTASGPGAGAPSTAEPSLPTPSRPTPTSGRTVRVEATKVTAPPAPPAGDDDDDDDGIDDGGKDDADRDADTDGDTDG